MRIVYTRLNTIIGRYIFLEMIPPFVINLLFFSFIFLLTKSLDIADMVVNYDVGIGTVTRMVVYNMPYFLVFVIPMSVMTAVLLTFLRLSGDNEITALKSSGINILQLLPPVLLLCLVGFLLCGIMTFSGLPWGRQALRRQAVDIATAGLNLELKQRTFIDIEKVMLYINRIDQKKNELIDILVEDQRNKSFRVTVIAPRGSIEIEREPPAINLKLYNGSIHRVNLDRRKVITSRFETYRIHLDMASVISRVKDRRVDEKDMYLSELISFIRSREKEKDGKYWESLVEFHRKFAVPFACFFLGLLAVPLGIQPKRGRRSFGIGLSMAFFLIYYFLFAIGKVYGESGDYPPILGMWMPNIVTCALGIYLIKRTLSEQPLRLDAIGAWIDRVRIPNIFKKGQ